MKALTDALYKAYKDYRKESARERAKKELDELRLIEKLRATMPGAAEDDEQPTQEAGDGVA